MSQIISKKISLLNQTTLDSLGEMDVNKIIGNFVDVGLQILDADFGFAWWRTNSDSKYHLAYKSSTTPYEPRRPRERGGNFVVEKTRIPFFVEHVIRDNYEKEFDVSIFMKSYVIVPITYNDLAYGSLVLCYTNGHIFSEEDRQLAISLGNVAAQTITIHHLKISERKSIRINAEHEARIREIRVREEFIANATHEIRTPLAIIRGNADLALQKIKTNPRFVMDALKSINEEVEHLSNLITDLSILTSSDEMVSRGKIRKEFDLSASVNSTIKRCRTLASKSRIKINVNKHSDIKMYGDRVNIERLVINLIRNAINYGKRGGWIKVNLKQIGDRVMLTISDNGIGISKEDLPYVFNRFYRADSSRNNGNNTGLGLAIAKWVVTAHKGTIKVHSTLGKGTVFSISLPTLRKH